MADNLAVVEAPVSYFHLRAAMDSYPVFVHNAGLGFISFILFVNFIYSSKL